MRIECMILKKTVHIMMDICHGCELTNNRPAQVVQGTDGRIDACIRCPREGEEENEWEVLRSEEKTV